MQSSLAFKSNPISITIILFLVIGQLCLSSIFGSSLYSIIGFTLLLGWLSINHGKYISSTDYIIILLGLSFFDYSSSKGGLWNYINIFYLVILLLLRKFQVRFPKNIQLFFSFYVIICLLEILIINPGSLSDKFTFVLVYFSFVFAFLYSSSLNFNDFLFYRLTKVLSILIAVQFFICLNQRFDFIYSTLPFFPSQKFVEDYDLLEFGLGVNKVRNWGSLSNFELFAEINSMIFVFYLTALVKYKSYLVRLKIVPFSLIIITFSFLNILMSGTRSSLMLVLMSIIYICISEFKKIFFNRKSVYLLGTACMTLMVFGSFIFNSLGLETLFVRLSYLESSEINIVTGEGMNREGTYELAKNRIGEENWLLGNGYAFGETYKKIMQGDYDTEFGDFHNLYLSLPLIYGWIGTIFFLLIFLYPIYKLFQSKVILRDSFLIFWLVFFVNEYKIQFIRDAGYTMIIWIFLGLTYSFLRSGRKVSY